VDLESWAWLVLAVILFGAEVLSPGLLMLPFGLGAVTALVASVVSADPLWQWVAFFVVSSVSMVVFQRYVVRRKRR